MTERTCVGCGTSLGVNPHGNRKYCSEDCRKRTWDRNWLASDKSRAICSDCGEKLARGSAQPSVRRRHEEAQGTPRQGCPGCARKRRNQIVEWWADGVPYKQIVERLGWTRDHLAVEMDRMRKLGFDLPYRYRLSKPAHPEQVAA